jgi:DNA-binding transcriptional ArsR family regulator
MRCPTDRRCHHHQSRRNSEDKFGTQQLSATTAYLRPRAVPVGAQDCVETCADASESTRLRGTRIDLDRGLRKSVSAGGADLLDGAVARRWTDPRRSITLRYVPKYYDELDAVLRALADPTRRAVVERLAKSPAVVSELAAPFSMALPSLMQHLSVLENAGVVTSEKHGRVRTVSLRPGALDVLHLWLGEQRTPAERQADRLGIHLSLTTPKDT